MWLQWIHTNNISYWAHWDSNAVTQCSNLLWIHVKRLYQRGPLLAHSEIFQSLTLMNIWRVKLFNWKKCCDHQGSLLGGWVCVFLLIRVPLCLRRSKLPEFIKMMSEHFVWWSSNPPGDRSNTPLSSARPINRSGTLAKSVWSATWLSSYVVFSIVSLCRELWTLHLKWTGRSSGAPPPLWRTAGASDGDAK